MENYRLLEAGMPNLVSALKGNPVSVKRLITFDEDVNESGSKDDEFDLDDDDEDEEDDL